MLVKLHSHLGSGGGFLVVRRIGFGEAQRLPGALPLFQDANLLSHDGGRVLTFIVELDGIDDLDGKLEDCFFA